MAAYTPRGSRGRRGAAAFQTVVVLLVLVALAGGAYWIYKARTSGEPATTEGSGDATAGGGAREGSGNGEGSGEKEPSGGETGATTGGAESDRDIPGKAEFKSQEYKEAVEKLARHVADNPDDAEALSLLGRSRLELGQVAEGEADLEKAMKLDPAASHGVVAALCLGDSLYKRAYQNEATKDSKLWEKTRAAYSSALRRLGYGADRKQVLERLEELNGHLLWSRRLSSDSVMHTVKAGQTVEGIAVDVHGLPRGCTASIARINKIDPRRIRPGQTLKVIKPLDMEIFVSKRHLRLTAFLNGYYFKEFPVGIGKDDSTPAGEFVIRAGGKDKDPNWTVTKPDSGLEVIKFGDPRNILGTRWMGFKNIPELGATSLGIHGTTKPESVPGRESAGCVRMLNPDVELLYDFTPEGTKVIVSD